MNQSSISENDRKDDLDDTDPTLGEDGDRKASVTSDELAVERDDFDAGESQDAILDDPEDHGDAVDDPMHADESHGGGLAATALKFLIFVLVIFGLSLWLVPMVAPHLPASVAKHLMPGQHEIDTRLAAIGDQVNTKSAATQAAVEAMQTQLADLTQRLAASEDAAAKAREEADAARLAAEASAQAAQSSATADSVLETAEAAARDAADTARTATTAATEAGKVASAATRDTASLARRMTNFEARMASLSQEISALTENLATAPAGSDGAGTAELTAAYAALKARVDALGEQTAAADFVTRDEADRFATHDDLRSTRTALQAESQATIGTFPAPAEIVTTEALEQVQSSLASDLSGLSERVAGAENTVAIASKAATAAETAAADAVSRVDGAIKQASMRSAIAALTSRMSTGAPFASALAELETLSGTLSPSALGTAAQSGVATPRALLRGFGGPAQAAIAAEIRANSGDDLLSQANAKLKSVIAGRPKNEQPGDDAAAILSRVEARLRDGLVVEALSEAETLGDAPKSAMDDWLDRLRKSASAQEALSTFLSEISGSQG